MALEPDKARRNGFLVDGLVIIAMIVIAAAFAAALMEHVGIGTLPSLVAGAALLLVMISSQLVMSRVSRTSDASRMDEFEEALEIIDGDLQRIDRMEGDVARIGVLSEKVERLDKVLTDYEAASLTRLSSDVESLQTRLESLRTDLEVETRSQRETLYGELKQLEGLMKQLSRDLAGPGLSAADPAAPDGANLGEAHPHPHPETIGKEALAAIAAAEGLTGAFSAHEEQAEHPEAHEEFEARPEPDLHAEPEAFAAEETSVEHGAELETLYAGGAEEDEGLYSEEEPILSAPEEELSVHQAAAGAHEDHAPQTAAAEEPLSEERALEEEALEEGVKSHLLEPAFEAPDAHDLPVAGNEAAQEAAQDQETEQEQETELAATDHAAEDTVEETDHPAVNEGEEDVHRTGTGIFEPEPPDLGGPDFDLVELESAADEAAASAATEDADGIGTHPATAETEAAETGFGLDDEEPLNLSEAVELIEMYEIGSPESYESADHRDASPDSAGNDAPETEPGAEELPQAAGEYPADRPAEPQAMSLTEELRAIHEGGNQPAGEPQAQAAFGSEASGDGHFGMSDEEPALDDLEFELEELLLVDAPDESREAASPAAYDDGGQEPVGQQDADFKDPHKRAGEPEAGAGEGEAH